MMVLSGCNARRAAMETKTSRADASLASGAATSWKTVAPNVALREFQTAASDQDLAVKIIAVRALPSRVHIVGGAKLTADEWRQKIGATAVVNGGYFDPEGHPLGLRISGNKRTSDLHPADWGVFLVEGSAARIIHTRDYQSLRAQGKTHRVLEAIQCGPRLVVNGQFTTLKPQWARRTALGIDSNGRVVIAIADGELSFAAWQTVWRDNLSCPNALNLDGGGSTQISLQTSKENRDVSGSWPVPDVVCIR